MKISNYICYILAALLSAFAAFFFVADSVSIISLVCSLLYIIIAMNKPLEDRFCFVAMAIPNTKSLCIGPISVAICICALTVFFDLLNKKNKKNKKCVIPGLICIYVIYSLQLLLRFGINEGIIMPIKMSMALLFFLSLSSNKYILNNSFVYGLKVSICLFVGIFFALIASLFNSFDFGRVAVAGNDSNMLAVEVVSVVAYLCVVYYTTDIIKQFLFLLVLGIACFIGLLCGSRMGLLLIAISLLYSMLMNITQLRKSIIFIIGFFILLLVIVTSEYGQLAIELLKYRNLALESQDDFSNGRFEIWQQYFDVFNENPIRWLVGLGDFKQYDIEMQAHNFLIEDIASYGIIGTLLLYSIIYQILRKQFLNHNSSLVLKKHLFKCLPLFIPIIGGLTLHGLTSIMNLTMLYIGILALSTPSFKKGYENFAN